MPKKNSALTSRFTGLGYLISVIAIVIIAAMFVINGAEAEDAWLYIVAITVVVTSFFFYPKKP